MLRWPFWLSIGDGYDDPEEPRDEGQWFAAQGKVAALVMANPGYLRTRDDLDETRLDQLLGNARGQTVVFISDIEHHAGPWRTRGLRTAGTPLGLGALSAVVLLTPVLYRAYGGKLRWRRPVNRHS